MELNEPLGMKPKPGRPDASTRRDIGDGVPGDRGRSRTPWIVGGVVAVAVSALTAIVMTSDPHGGEPYAVALIPPPAPKLERGDAALAPTLSTAVDPMRTGSIPNLAASNMVPRPTTSSTGEAGKMVAGTMENGVRVFRSTQPSGAAPDASGGGPLIIDVSKVLDDPLHRSKTLLGDPRPGAMVPPLQAAPGQATAQPRVAIFVSGMGLSQAATKTAIETMPAPVTFAFVPYGASVQASVAAAKARGHEILLQIPMQSGTGAAPGPHALRPGESQTALAEDLAWLSSRFEGYDGVTNLLGAPVTADAPTMTALLKEIGSRNLFYLDDGLSKRSLASSLAASQNLAAARADLVIDATADPATVRANLDALVATARRKGSAIGMASGLPDHMAIISRFANDLAGQGVALVPVAALVVKAPATKAPATMAVTR